MMTPPSFWTDQDGYYHPLALLLSPLAALYDFVAKRRRARIVPMTSSLPIICIGNITMGGVGKTPSCLAVAAGLTEQGRRPAILLRGYGGQETGPAWVDKDAKAEQFGDEALLYAKTYPTCVSVDRAMGAAFMAQNPDVDIILMDDGFQNNSLSKDYSILVIDEEVAFGNGRIFPAGPLREAPSQAFNRANAVVLVRPAQTSSTPMPLEGHLQGLPCYPGCIETVNKNANSKTVIAFAGIGRPQKFFDTLARSGYKCLQTYAFSDHHVYTQEELQMLQQSATQYQAPLMTTEKDWVRLPEEMQQQTEFLPVRMHVPQMTELLDAIMEAAANKK
ncbi:MAG: tetraacyldisaccharide 4'-kinase [bacterium]